MNPPTPEEARKALDRLVIYANNGWGSACPGEVDTLRRFIDAHSAPVQPEPVGWANAVEWLRNHYQDHPTIDGLCSAMRSASPPPAQPSLKQIVQAAVDRVHNTIIVEAEAPEKLRNAIAKRVADLAAGTFAFASPPPAQPAPEWTDAKLRGIASDYFTDSKDWPAAMLCLRHLLMEQGAAQPAQAEPVNWMPFALTVAAALDRGDDARMLFDENSPIRDELRTLIAKSRGDE